MADKDLELNIRTVADLTGVRKAADAIALLNEQAKKQAAGAAAGGPPEEASEIAAKIEHGFLRSALHLVGAGAVFEAINEIKKTAEEINKITESLDKQGEQLVKNVQLMAEASRFAQTQEDIVKTGEAGLKGIAAQHKIVLELQKQELSYWQQFIDSIAKGGQLGIGPLQQALNSAVETAAKLEATARETTIADVQAEKTKLARRETQSFDETVKELTDRIKEQQALADTHWANKDIDSYISVTRTIENYKKELSDVIKLEEQRIKAADAAAKPLTKALTTPTGAFVAEQEKAEYEHQAKRAALEQQRREAIGSGDEERAKAIQDELTHDRFARDQRKEQLQRYVANQESLFRQPGETGADIARDLGSLGAKKYEAARAELEDIYKQQKAEVPAGIAGGGDRETHRLLNELIGLFR